MYRHLISIFCTCGFGHVVQFLESPLDLRVHPLRPLEVEVAEEPRLGLVEAEAAEALLEDEVHALPRPLGAVLEPLPEVLYVLVAFKNRVK